MIDSGSCWNKIWGTEKKKLIKKYPPNQYNIVEKNYDGGVRWEIYILNK